MYLRKNRWKKNGNSQERKVAKPGWTKMKLKIQTICKFKKPMVLLIISKGYISQL